MKREERIKVRITESANWYKKDEIHEVGNYVSFTFHTETPHFEKKDGMYGIDCKHCEILNNEVPEYTMAELFDKIGHKFKVTGA